MAMRRVSICALISCLAIWAHGAAAQEIRIERPGEREFVLDLANLIDADDEEAIREECDSLLTDSGSPLIVVTIESMARHIDDRSMYIEGFALRLFNQWGVGHVEIEGQQHNRGMLIVVSRDDRKARIELGAGWSEEVTRQAQWIMDGTIIPRFKRGEFSEGIKAGVLALGQMARGPAAEMEPETSGAPPSSSGGSSPQSDGRVSTPPPSSGFKFNGLACFWPALIVLAIVIVGLIVSRAIRGSSTGAATGVVPHESAPRSSSSSWMNWLPLLWMMSQSQSARNRSWWSGGGSGFGGGGGFGGFSGGSFGGGFSGGRGASGGW